MTILTLTQMIQDSWEISLGVYLPLGALLLIFILVVPGMKSGANIFELCKAAYCYAAQSIGISLMLLSSLPVLQSVLAGQWLPTELSMALLLLFAVGGILLLFHESMGRKIEHSAREVPEALFFFMWKLAGLALVLLAGLSFGLLLSTSSSALLEGGAWTTYISLLMEGVVMLWFTSIPSKGKSGAFHMVARSVSAVSIPVRRPKKKSKGKK